MARNPPTRQPSEIARVLTAAAKLAAALAGLLTVMHTVGLF